MLYFVIVPKQCHFYHNKKGGIKKKLMSPFCYRLFIKNRLCFECSKKLTLETKEIPMKTLKRCTSYLLLLALFVAITPIQKPEGNDYPVSVCGDDDDYSENCITKE